MTKIFISKLDAKKWKVKCDTLFAKYTTVVTSFNMATSMKNRLPHITAV